MTTPIRVVVIDHHTLIRFGLFALFTRHPDVKFAGDAGNASDGRKLVAAEQPDVVTVAVGLPDTDGLTLARELRDRYPALGIVVLTSQGEDDVMFRALETGVSAFVAKNAQTDEVLAAVRHAAVAARSFTASGLAGALARRSQRSERTMLSPREREVLLLLGEGMSIPAIAKRMYLSQSTTKTYVSRLYDKLGASNRAQALMTALRTGLIQHQEQDHDRPHDQERTPA